MLKKNLAKRSLIALLVIVVLSSLISTLVFVFPRGVDRRENAHIEKAMTFINGILSAQNTIAELVSWKKESGMYKMNLKVKDQEVIVFLSSDGRYLFLTPGIDLWSLTKAPTEASSPQQEATSTPEKRDRPDVKLFVMSYCPYGIQMEKALFPVYDLLKDKVDFQIYFVNYILHGEKEMLENLRQYCIQKEDREGFFNYLKCFDRTGNYSECLKEAKIDEKKISQCMDDTDKEFKLKDQFSKTEPPPFPIHNDLNLRYNVRASPTFVLNDILVDIERSPQKIKEAICNGFNTPPEECNQNLSTAIPSPGLGNGGSSNNSEGECK